MLLSPLFWQGNSNNDLSVSGDSSHELSTCYPTALLDQDRSYPRAREPRGSGIRASCHIEKTTRSGGSNIHIAASILLAASFSVCPAAGRNPAGLAAYKFTALTSSTRTDILSLSTISGPQRFRPSPKTATPLVQTSTEEVKQPVSGFELATRIKEEHES